MLNDLPKLQKNYSISVCMRIEKETCHLCVKFMLLYMKKNKIQPIFAGSGKWMGCCFACCTLDNNGHRIQEGSSGEEMCLDCTIIWPVLLYG